MKRSLVLLVGLGGGWRWRREQGEKRRSGVPDRNVLQDKKSGNVGWFNRQSAVKAKWGCTHACARSPAGHILCFDGAINRRKAAVKRIESRVRSVCLSPVRLAPSGLCRSFSLWLCSMSSSGPPRSRNRHCLAHLSTSVFRTFRHVRYVTRVLSPRRVRQAVTCSVLMFTWPVPFVGGLLSV